MDREETAASLIEDRERIQIKQHFANGGEIQWRLKGSTDAWNSASTPTWDFRLLEYRKKPEPREWWHILDGRDTVVLTRRKVADIQDAFAARLSEVGGYGPYTIVRSKEVL